jgi:hypothetical protein
MRHWTMFWMGLLLTTLVASPAWAQKSLEELMAETNEEIAAEEKKDGGEKGDATGDAKPKTLEELMNEGEEDKPQTLEQLMGDGGDDDDEFEGSLDDLPGAKADGVKGEVPKNKGPGGGFFLGIVALIVISILLGAPLYILIGSVTLYLLFYGGVFTEFRLLASIIEQTRSLSDKEVLLAIPFFVVSGALMTEGDIATRLIRFADVIFGRLPGGLAISAVFACAFFAAVSGSSPVTVIAIGSIMYPALIKDGYPRQLQRGPGDLGWVPGDPDPAVHPDDHLRDRRPDGASRPGRL